MSRYTYSSMNGTPDYELHCDSCGTRFDCSDDSFYSWPVLCDAAEAEGWQLSSGPEGHLCAACRAVPTGASALDGRRGRSDLVAL
jgi:hypothetical protein